MKPEDLITYCGVYGGTCETYVGYPHRRQLARIFAELLDAGGYEHWMPAQAKEFDYGEFRKGLEFFSSEDNPESNCHNCCKGGGGNPTCTVRLCCQEKHIEICSDCTDFPCDKLTSDGIARLSEYRELGKEEWLRRQVQMAEQGYELHTRKYYRIHAERTPPD